jgi:glycosyltransferase involved in cell wall biosynthesis
MLEFEKLQAITPAPVSVVLPVFNQAGTITRDLQVWQRTLEEQRCGFQLIVVDDGSPDGTGDIVSRLGEPHSELTLLRHDCRRGFGAALRTGLAAAHHPLLVYVMGGQGYQAANLMPMLKWIDEVHLVAGYRVPSTGKRISQTAWWRRRLARTCLGVAMRDLGCYFVLARRAIFERIPIQSTTTFAHLEVLAKANFLGSLMTEVPVTVDSSSRDESRWECESGQVRVEMMKVFRNPDFGAVAERKNARS